jgi:phosphomevalonate kinase
MLFGEYAVLEGAPSLVAAVDRYAIATPSGGAEPTPFVAAAIEAVKRYASERGLRATYAVPSVDSSALYAAGDGGRKLGLGSSAAATVAAFGALALQAGDDLSDHAAIFAACEEAHGAAQGIRGSGADVAAAVYGGVVRFGRGPAGAYVNPIALSPKVEITLVDTGAAASTSERLTRLSAIRSADVEAYKALLRPLAHLSIAVAGEVENTGIVPFAAVDEWRRALDHVAAAIGLEIVTARHRAVAEAARAVDGVAKPSGAGGGDLAVCFTPAGSAEALRTELSRRGLAPLDVSVGAQGLSVVPSHLSTKKE